MESWIDQLAEALGEEPLTGAETTLLLGAARDVAHRVERKVTPLAAFLLGAAAGRSMAAGAARGGALAQRIGPRIPITVGALAIGGGFALLSGVRADRGYLTNVLPGVLVFGFGLVLTVAPLTATVLAAVDDRQAGVGSAINNAVARIASLLVIAVIPTLAGIASDADSMGSGFARAMWLCAVLAILGAAMSWLSISVDPRAAKPKTADVGSIGQ